MQRETEGLKLFRTSYSEVRTDGRGAGVHKSSIKHDKRVSHLLSSTAPFF